MRALERTAPIGQDPAQTFPALIDSLAERFGSSPALLSENQTLSYREFAARVRGYANWAHRQGLSTGDVVCLLMPNCAEYAAIWFGITRIGAIVSLLNTNLVGDSLAHAINVVAPKRIVVGAALVDALADVRSRVSPAIQISAHGDNSRGIARIDHEIDREGAPNDRDYRPPMLADRALYIYTSGTTGLPKPVNVSHFRLMQWSHWFAGMMDTRPDDRIYNCLPMYHSVGGVVAIGAALVNGGSVAIRERFSASRFWDDVVESKCTIFQYIGELCRYLVNTPSQPQETQHRLRLACGNGLAADVWKEFERRFHVPQILEFYAATEGNFSLYNCEGKVGAIGRIPSFLPHRQSVALVKFDHEAGKPLCGQDGFCIRCAADEIGEAIGQIADERANGAGGFEGYTDKAATEKKILRNVFVNGDAWYRTGDLMRRDESGFFYFVDRVGDTFRWKGENVSTTEVAAVASASPRVAEAVVYGVAVAGNEGRAGMVAAVVRENFDIGAFHRHLTDELPQYARPLFLRIRKAIDATGTFRPKRNDLVRESYDPSASEDAIYFNDPVQQAFVRVDSDLFDCIQSGRMRF